LNTILQEDLSGIRVIRAFGREGYELERYQQANTELLDRNMMTVRALSNNFPLVFFFANLGTLVVIGFGGALVMGGSLSIGELIAFNAYLAFLLQPILNGDVPGLARTLVGLLAVYAGGALATRAQIFQVGSVGQRLLASLRGRLFGHSSRARSSNAATTPTCWPPAATTPTCTSASSGTRQTDATRPESQRSRGPTTGPPWPDIYGEWPLGYC
jgi:ABC-type transport system involved in cytochrome bd biosynthesis fused ATPase/permease subunit